MRFTISLLGIALLCASISYGQNTQENKEFKVINGKKYAVVKKVETKTQPKLMSREPKKVVLIKSAAIEENKNSDLKK